jgi:uncharacterized protein
MKRDATGKLLLGLGTGLVFGWLLQRSQASRHEAMAGQLHGEDSRVARLMITAAAVGAIVTQALQRRGRVELSPKPLHLGGVIGGGIVFGAGMGLLGHCPGTSIAALGEGNVDALFGVLGMLAGAGAFVVTHSHIEPLLRRGDFGAPTLPELTHTSAWPWAGLLAAAAAGSKLLNDANRPSAAMSA